MSVWGSDVAVEPGKYRHRVAIERKVEAQDATTGEVSHTWAPLSLSSDVTTAAVPAQCLTGPGREAKLAGAPQAAATLRVAFRWFPGLRATDRIVWQSVAYDIAGIETDATGRREYRVTCTGGLNDGGR